MSKIKDVDYLRSIIESKLLELEYLIDQNSSIYDVRQVHNKILSTAQFDMLNEILNEFDSHKHI